MPKASNARAAAVYKERQHIAGAPICPFERPRGPLGKTRDRVVREPVPVDGFHWSHEQIGPSRVPACESGFAGSFLGAAAHFETVGERLLTEFAP